MATAKTVEELLPHLRRAVRELYGPDPRRCEAYGRMINDKHFDRVVGLIDDDQVVLGGTRGSAGASGADRASRYLPPTIMTGVDWTDPVMAEEVFGRSEEHTSELQSRGQLVCRLLLGRRVFLGVQTRHKLVHFNTVGRWSL